MSLPPEKPSEKSSLPPPTPAEIEANAALEAACESATEASKKLEAATTKLQRTISDSKMQAVRVPMPSETELEAQPPKR